MGTYVDEVDVCDFPIENDDTRGSTVWLYYREWLYLGKIAKKYKIIPFAIDSF